MLESDRLSHLHWQSHSSGGEIASLEQRIKFRASTQIDKFISLYTLILYL